jgi:hypothetical protein
LPTLKKAGSMASTGGRLGRYGKFKHKRDDYLVGDADKMLEFEITAQDIANGIPRHAFKCPAALALRRILGAKYDVVVNRGIVKIINDKEKLMMRFATGGKLAKAYPNFDDEIKPNFDPGGTYELLPVPGWNRLGGKKRKRVTTRKPAGSGVRKYTRPKRWIVGTHNISILRNHPFLRETD